MFADPLAALIEDAVDPSERFLSVSRTSDAFCSWSSSRNPRIRSASSAQGAPHRMRGSAMKKVSGKKHREPSRARASLREMPEVNFGGAKIRRNPYALRIAREGISIHSGRGRPRKGTETGPTIPRSRPESGSIWKGAPRRKASRYMLHCAPRSWRGLTMRPSRYEGVARRLAKAKVAGSNPVLRSKSPGFHTLGGSGLFHGRRLSWRRPRFTTISRCGFESFGSASLRTR